MTPVVGKTLDELENLSDRLLEHRRDFYERVQGKDEEKAAADVDQEAKDYANVIAALKRQHEEEKRRLLEDVQQNWFHRDYYDAYAAESECVFFK